VARAPTPASGASARGRPGAAGSVIERRVDPFEFLSRLAAEVSKGTVNLPCFPDIVLRIRKALSDPRNTPENTVKIVGTEPRLAARLLQTANSAIFNPTGKPLTDLRTAITRLGHQLVQCVAMAFAVQQMKAQGSLRVIAEPLNRLWEKSIAVASICQVLARRTHVPPEEAFLTGLLHGIGRLYIMVRAADDAHGPHYDHALAEMVADWHPAIGRAVLENWGFVEAMSEAVGDQANYERKPKREADLTDILIIGVLLADALQDEKFDLSRCTAASAFAALRLTQKECIAILRHTHYQLGSMHDALGC
jgi:HD-like signal output (HDOD) protein